MSKEAPDKELSDEEMRKLLKPAPSFEQVLLALQSSYAEPGQSIKFVKDLDSYDDRNFWIEIDGTPYLAKVHNGVESKDFLKHCETDYAKSVIHLQNVIMEHLSKNGINTSAPAKPLHSEFPTPASIHSLPVASSAHSPCKLVIRLLQWVKGNTMSSVKMLPLETFADAGRYVGHMSQKLSEIDTTELLAAKRFHQWDGKNTLGLRNFTSAIPDPARKALVESILDAFQHDLIDSKVSESFPTSIIHGDCNDANLLVDSNLTVTGVIDFGDSVETWRVLELTIAMAYAMLSVYGKSKRSISAAAAVLRGFNAVCPLTELERKHLILLVCCRLACSATLGAYSIQQNPENEYLLLHAQPCWDALNRIWGPNEGHRQGMAKALNRIFSLACEGDVDPDAEIIDCSDLSFPDPCCEDALKDVRDAYIEKMRPTKRQKSN